jgi:hypothetical protein
MDRASQVLAKELSPDVRNTYCARAEHGEVPHTTLYYRALGRCSKEEGPELTVPNPV